MIKLNKMDSDSVCQCTSCQKENGNEKLYEIKIGKDERQTTTIRLCHECLCDFVGKLMMMNKD